MEVLKKDLENWLQLMQNKSQEKLTEQDMGDWVKFIEKTAKLKIPNTTHHKTFVDIFGYFKSPQQAVETTEGHLTQIFKCFEEECEGLKNARKNKQSMLRKHLQTLYASQIAITETSNDRSQTPANQQNPLNDESIESTSNANRETVLPTWSQIGREDNHNIPVTEVPNQFYGRQDELSRLLRYLTPEYSIQRITVSGIGGVGKTTLILEAACKCLGYMRYQDSCEFNPRSLPQFDLIIFSSAKEQSLSSLGLRQIPNPSRTLIEIFKDISRVLKDDSIMLGTIPEIQNGIYQRFANNRVLLILDNFETITDEKNVKDFIEGLAFEAPRTKVIISSRKSSEMLYHIPVPELNKNQTFDLIDNLLNNSLCSTSTPTQELKNTIYETTGGVPLAIKIIMGMISTEHKYQYSKDQLFDNLEGKSGEGVLPFIFAESIGRLNKNNTYRILLATAMFPKKPFTLEAIAEIAGMSDISKDDILECLDELNCMQLVSPKKGRYSMLSLTQSYCLKELESNSDMKGEYYERRFSFYKQFVEEHCTYKKNNIERIKNYDKVDKEWDNILAIIMWCKDKNYYERVKDLWFLVNNYANLRGHWRDRLTWLEYILSNSQGLGEYKYAARSQMNMARILLLQGTEQKLYEAETLLKDAWRKREKLDATDIDYIANHFAGLYLRLGNYKEAHRWLEVEQKNLNESTSINDSDRIRYQLYINRERGASQLGSE